MFVSHLGHGYPKRAEVFESVSDLIQAPWMRGDASSSIHNQVQLLRPNPLRISVPSVCVCVCLVSV